MTNPSLTFPEFPLYIGGEWRRTTRWDTINLPYDGAVVAKVAHGTAADMNEAIEAAVQGSRSMAAMANCERADLLLRIAEFLRRDAAEFVRLLCSETGKPIREARVEVDRAIQTVTAAAQEARNLHGEVVPMDAFPPGKGRMAMTVREPLGVIGAITPFNVPLNLALHKVAPALAGGNAVVLKPAERTPLTALLLAKILEEAGAPEGAYNVVSGDGPELGAVMLANDAVAMITFTGSVRVGKYLRQNAGLKKVTLEMGNNSAAIIESDADLELAVTRTVQGGFAMSGQVCISVQRVFVQESIADRFIEQLELATSKLRIGHPYDETTDISSLIDESQAIRVESWIQEAIAEGATLVCGGRRKGSTVEPTVLTEAPDSSRVCSCEVFGPLVVVNRYQNLDEAIRRVNNSPYGLQAGIFTRDLAAAFSAARKLHVGGVIINDVPMYRVDHMPYGGMKQSGLGREGPRYAIEEMTEPKLICWRC